MKIRISGLEKLQDGEKIKTSGNSKQRIQQLLAAYNHIIIRDDKGQIERIVIISKKQHRETNRIVLPTRHKGNHLIVTASLTGNGRIWKNIDMIIDTGADLVVLPKSMIEKLGLNSGPFTSRDIQTANGVAEAQIGQIQELKIAGESIKNIEAAFIEDNLLGQNCLLGMNVLKRYQINIDHSSQSITLFKKY